jgi:superfamily I DNA and/or RNA helicase
MLKMMKLLLALSVPTQNRKTTYKTFCSGNFSTLLQKSVKIDTVDSYQGKENRIVVFSVTRNTPNFSSAFLASENRVNVALSRSMDRLVIFGATEMWEHEENSNSPLYKTLAYQKPFESTRIPNTETS